MENFIKGDSSNSLWVARNREGDLHLFSRKPHLGYEDRPVFREIWCCGTMLPFCCTVNRRYCVIQLEDNMFPDITFENSPAELKL